MYLPRCIVSLSFLVVASSRECGTCSGPGIGAGALPHALPLRRISTISAHIVWRSSCPITSFARQYPRCCSVTYHSSVVSLLPPLCRRRSGEASLERRGARCVSPRQGPSARCFRYREYLVCLHVPQRLHHPAGPVQLHQISLRRRAQAEARHVLALRAVAATAAHPGHLPAARYLQHDARAKALAIALDASGTNRQPVVAISAVVAQERRVAVVGGDQQIRIAVAVEIAHRQAAPYPRLRDPVSRGLTDVAE